MAKPQTKDQANESVASILSKIKNMVSGKEKISLEEETKGTQVTAPEDEEPLELTEVIDEGNNAPEQEPDNTSALNNADFSAATEEKEEFVDLLQEIDQALEAQYHSSPEDKNPPVIAVGTGAEADKETAMADIAKNMRELIDEQDKQEAGQMETEKDISVPQPEIQAEQIPQAQPVYDSNANLAQNHMQNDMSASNPARNHFPDYYSQNIMNAQAARPMRTEKKDTILSDDIASKSSRAIQNLLNNLPRPNIDSPAFRSAVTIEDLVMETMKPLLKEWLDKNLETIVRDIVEREIKKIMPRE